MTYLNQRRKALKKMMMGSAALATPGTYLSCKAESQPLEMLKGNINHSVCAWTYNHLTLEELCVLIKDIGFSAIDLVGPQGWPILKKHGIDSSMCNGAEINLVHGFNNKQYHPKLVENYTEMIPLVSKAGYKNLICFSGNRDGMDDETGLKNSLEGIKKVVSLAEKNNVILVMELLNSKIDHKDYMADKSAWGIELCKQVGSEHFKLLFDIYHMQIDEGDVTRSIQNNHQYFAHYHTGGNPGRNEIGEDQELNYRSIMKAIQQTGFTGYVAQEFIPKAEDKEASLREAIAICDI